MVLRVRGSTGSLGKLTLQRDCGVSWRYQAIALTKGVADFGQGALKLTYNALLVDVDWGVAPSLVLGSLLPSNAEPAQGSSKPISGQCDKRMLGTAQDNWISVANLAVGPPCSAFRLLFRTLPRIDSSQP